MLRRSPDWTSVGVRASRRFGMRLRIGGLRAEEREWENHVPLRPICEREIAFVNAKAGEGRMPIVREKHRHHRRSSGRFPRDGSAAS